MKKWGRHVLETGHEGKEKVVVKDLWGASVWPKAHMKRRSQPGQELGAEWSRWREEHFMQQPRVGTSCGCSRNRMTLVWPEHGKGKEEQDDMRLEDKQESDHIRTVGQWRQSSMKSPGGRVRRTKGPEFTLVVISHEDALSSRQRSQWTDYWDNRFSRHGSHPRTSQPRTDLGGRSMPQWRHSFKCGSLKGKGERGGKISLGDHQTQQQASIYL